MDFKIFKDKEHINTIVATEDFVKDYCAKNGYTYVPLSRTPSVVADTPAEPDATTEDVTWDALAAAYQEGVNNA